jgi:hypothetical protein
MKLYVYRLTQPGGYAPNYFIADVHDERKELFVQTAECIGTIEVQLLPPAKTT